jgi:hypothetical protein
VRISSQSVTHTCAICERRLLTGERVARFAPPGGQLVDVCPLCQEQALEFGWVKEGSPMTPMLPPERRRRPRLVRLLAPRRDVQAQPVAAEPILRRLSEAELALVESADLFNASDYRRTVGGIAKSLGRPNASIVSLSGVNAELVITIAWDLSWYQYRVSLDAVQPVRLAERGQDPSDLDRGFTAWNARIEDDGRLVPDIALV